MKYNFDKTVNRLHTSSYKWGDDNFILPMWVADMDFPVLKEIKTAIKARADIDAYGYSGVPSTYYEAYRNWYLSRHHVDIDVSNMVFSTGVVASIDSIFKHILPPKSGIIVFTPIYHVFFNCIKNNGHQLLENELIYDKGEYHIDYLKLEQSLKDENCKALLLCNPHNPIGKIWEEDDLKKIVKLCEKYHVLLISDEIHCDILEPTYQYHSLLKYSDSSIVLLSPTKTFNIAGIQTSIVVSKNKELLNKIEQGLGQDDIGEPNYFSVDASIAAYKYGENWVDELNQYLLNNKKYVQEFINKYLPHLYLVDNHATYLLWLDISYYSNDSGTFSSKLKEETGLYVSPGSQFKGNGNNFLRINIATSLDNVKEGCKRLLSFIKNNY